MSSSSENIKQAYLRVEKMLSLRLGQTPDLQAITFLIGLQELGQLKRLFSKEEKQDLMHLGVCRLLSQEGYYTFAGRDEDGWPHFEKTGKTPDRNYNQETLLKKNIVIYFSDQNPLT